MSAVDLAPTRPRQDFFQGRINAAEQGEMQQERLAGLKAIFENAFESIFVVQDGRIAFANPKTLELAGCGREDLGGKPFLEIVFKHDREMVLEYYRRALKALVPQEPFVFRLSRADGSKKWVEAKALGIMWGKRLAGLFLGLDLTESKKATDELVVQAKHLRDLNTALTVLLEHRDRDLDDLKKGQADSLERLVRPYLDQVLRGNLDERQRVLLETALSNLGRLDSPAVDRFAGRETRLTRTEIEVADLIRRDKTTKEIADLLNCSPETISVHRRHIRKKFGLNKKKTSLKAFLCSLPDNPR
ncbi:MAG: PAS domain S-box protein [Pseudomonadota bacterium]